MNIADRMQAAFENKQKPHFIVKETWAVASMPGTKREAEKVIEQAKAAGDALAEQMVIKYVVCIPSASVVVGDIPLENSRRQKLKEQGMREADIPDARPMNAEEAQYLIDVAKDLGVPEADHMWVETRE